MVIKLIPFIIIIIVIIIIIIIIVIIIIIILRKKHSSDYYFMLVIYNKPCLPCIRVLVCTRRLYSPYFTECFPDTINWCVDCSGGESRGKNVYHFNISNFLFEYTLKQCKKKKKKLTWRAVTWRAVTRRDVSKRKKPNFAAYIDCAGAISRVSFLELFGPIAGQLPIV